MANCEFCKLQDNCPGLNDCVHWSEDAKRYNWLRNCQKLDLRSDCTVWTRPDDTPTGAASELSAGLGRKDVGRHEFKVPKMLLKPPTYWAEVIGVRRAIKVIDLQAAHLRQQGNNRAAHDLRDVARALKAAITKENAVAECVTLGWPNVRGNAGTTARTEG